MKSLPLHSIRGTIALLLPAIVLLSTSFGGPAFSAEVPDDSSHESELLSGTRQLIFEGKRAGEGYFRADGSYMVFQSERDAENPFYQIYLMDMEMGDVTRISPGFGKTTCAWVHPISERVLFASTHADPESKALQQAELDFRASGKERRYSWDYDPHFDLYEFDFDGNQLRQLTDAEGYDAEGLWSPDGEWIVFASNREAYGGAMPDRDRKLFETDQSFMMDIYVMRSDGSGLKRLTEARGYDGGPFFSPDGEKIAWRRFSENGLTAEIYTMNADGSNQKRITEFDAMSWAPYYHPSGDYLIFTTNRHGFENFELYMVDAEGDREPVRVTGTEGFDGLAVFTPNGAGLAWTTNRTPSGESQIFMARWNDERARELLGLDKPTALVVELANPPDLSVTAAAISADDLRVHIEFLASDQMEGRRAGTVGELRSTTYLASAMEAIGLEPAGDNGGYFQEFEFTAGVSLGSGNRFELKRKGRSLAFAAGEQWRPLAYSKLGAIPESKAVFAGYGIKAPKTDEFEEYNSYVHLDLQDKWVMVFRYMPEDISPELRQHYNTHSSLRYKAMTARDLGARGIIFVSGPNSKVKNQLVPLGFDVSFGATSIAAVTINDNTAQMLLVNSGESLRRLQDKLDTGDSVMGFPLPGIALSAKIELNTESRTARNVLGRLYASDAIGESAIIVGAHADHLGVGRTSSSLARDEEADAIHYGADDNASGVAGALEIAQYLVDQKTRGHLDMKRDIIFALWSGEEINLLGSKHFASEYANKKDGEPLRPELAAYLNLDMIGRLKDQVVLQGISSSSVWPGEIERRNVPVGLSITVQDDVVIPTDTNEFYLRGVPILNAFTGAHEDYHSPRDTVDKINYGGAEKISRFIGLIARSLATSDNPPDYVEVEISPEDMEVRANLRAYLGTIPDYVEAEIPGLPLSGVIKGGPADQAGLKRGDIIVELAGRKIENIYDYTFAIEALKIGVQVDIAVVRDGERIALKLTPGSRE
jgi:Tol biopolymer transport system component